MTTIEKIKNFLDQNDFKYLVNSQKLIVSLDFSQKVTIDCSETNKIKMTDQLTGWNFLTGFFPMSLKNAMIYNFVGGLILGFIFIMMEINSSAQNLILIYIVFIFWILIFIIYYAVKLENFRTMILSIEECP